MARRLDWDKDRRRRMGAAAARDREAERTRRRATQQRQQALQGFVHEHNLCCFKCKQRTGPWAKTGFSKRGPWAICQACVGGGA